MLELDCLREIVRFAKERLKSGQPKIQILCRSEPLVLGAPALYALGHHQDQYTL